jgi:hypothetical protein
MALIDIINEKLRLSRPKINTNFQYLYEKIDNNY